MKITPGRAVMIALIVLLLIVYSAMAETVRWNKSMKGGIEIRTTIVQQP